MKHEYPIVHSPLERRVESQGVFVYIVIYREKQEPHWVLEVVDQEGGSTVWEEAFASDRDAFAEAITTIKREGIGSFSRAARRTVH